MMTYGYLNIRFDSKYSKDLNTKDLILIIKKIDGLTRKDKCQFENAENFPWLVLSLINCNDRGNFSIDEGEYFEKINLIELIFSDNQESYDVYFLIGKDIANKINWEVIDDHTEEVIVNMPIDDKLKLKHSIRNNNSGKKK
ncbi:hypothetical protein [Flammeovirga aprica]|uniref:Uncharacterized protein n=1 Tax=Flammeovirga aprica JL-4 TaxID=694437 RepID=A0A7X9S1R4_9BACT|nr:hypothetical protein [Flammeovirga aprica]NME72758.1 hypothetical protein [Flammeovirga aprica JL-4]